MTLFGPLPKCRLLSVSCRMTDTDRSMQSYWLERPEDRDWIDHNKYKIMGISIPERGELESRSPTFYL